MPGVEFGIDLEGPLGVTHPDLHQLLHLLLLLLRRRRDALLPQQRWLSLAMVIRRGDSGGQPVKWIRLGGLLHRGIHRGGGAAGVRARSQQQRPSASSGRGVDGRKKTPERTQNRVSRNGML